jgi:CRP-like cAMP-binding protein
MLHLSRQRRRAGYCDGQADLEELHYSRGAASDKAECRRDPTLWSVLHLILLPLNGLRLREMLRLTRDVRGATQGDLNMDWLKPFTSVRRFNRGDVLFRKGDAADAMCFVVSGQFRLAELGKDILSGQIVGELGFLAPGQLRTQTLECIEDGEVLQITYEQVKQLYYQNPQFGFYFLQLTTRRLFENISSLERDLAACKAASISVRKV